MRPFYEKHTLCTDASSLKTAKRIITGRIGGGEDGDDDEEYYEELQAVDPGSDLATAIANQFVFFVEAQDEEQLVLIITPKHYTFGEADSRGTIYDQEMPIEALLPGEEAEDLNGCGTWVCHGFEGSVLDLVQDMLARGFEFSMELQLQWGKESWTNVVEAAFLPHEELRQLRLQQRELDASKDVSNEDKPSARPKRRL